MVFGVCNTPVIVGDEMWMYYSASTDIHCGSSPEKKVSIARAAWRLDGMVSLCAGDTEGIVETVPFNQQGTKLYVNADISQGQLLVEILDEGGRVIPGYEKANCQPLQENVVSHSVIWKNSDNLPRGKTIRLRFCLTHGNLYSYTIK